MTTASFLCTCPGNAAADITSTSSLLRDQTTSTTMYGFRACHASSQAEPITNTTPTYATTAFSHSPPNPYSIATCSTASATHRRKSDIPTPKTPKECVTEFPNKAARFRIPFYLVCDFESFLSPIHNDDGADVDAVKATNLIDEHRVCGFACHRVSEYPEHQTDPVVYSGPDVREK